MADKVALVRLRALNDAFDKAFDKSREKVEGLKKSIGDTENVGSKLSKLGTDFEKTFGTSMSKAGDKLTKGVTLPLAAVATGAVYAAVSWESAWAGVLKTVDGTSEQLNQLEEDLRDMAKELPASHGEIAAVAEAAGQLGIAVEDVAGFTRVMIDLGETTNLSAQDAAMALARFSNIMGTSASDVDRLGSTIVELGNNSATTERDIVELSTRLAAAGKLAGLSEADVLAFASAMSSVGVEAEAGGTALSKVFVAISDSVIDGGDKLETFARVAGMSAKEFADAFRRDPAQAITSFVAGLGSMSDAGLSTTAVFKDLELADERLMRALRSTGQAQGLLADQIGMARGAWEENNALQNEAAERYKTTAAQLGMLRNQIVDLGIDIGQKLLPVLNAGMGIVGAFVETFARLPDFLQYVIIGFGALAASIGPVLKAGGFLIDNFKQITHALRTVSGASGTTMTDIGKMGAAAVAASFAINALVQELMSLGDGEEQLAAISKVITKDMREQGDAYAGLRQFVEEQIRAQTDLGLVFEATGRSSDEITAALLEGDKAWMRLATSTKEGEAAWALAGEQSIGLSSAVATAVANLENLGPATESAGDAAVGAAGDFDAAAVGAYSMAMQAYEASRAMAGLFQSMFGDRLVMNELDQAIADFNGSLDKVGSSGGRAAQAVDLVAKKAEALDKATGDAQRAMRSWEDANDRVTTSLKAVEDAEKALQMALQGPSARDREDAEWDLTDARLSAEDASDAVADAEAKLVAAREEGDADKIRRAENDLEQARQRLLRVNRNVTDAETRLNEIKTWSATTSQAVKDAEDRVATAKRDHQRATEDLTVRFNEMQAASAKVLEVEDAAPSTFGNSSGAMRSHGGAVRDLEGDYLKLAQAIDRTITSIINADITEAKMVSQLDQVIASIMAVPGLTDDQRGELLRYAWAKKSSIMKFPGVVPGGQTPDLSAAEGFVGTLRGPTTILAAEAGEPEDALLVPHSKGGLKGVFDRMTAATAGRTGTGGTVVEKHYHFDMKVHEMTRPSAGELMARAELLAGSR